MKPMNLLQPPALLVLLLSLAGCIQNPEEVANRKVAEIAQQAMQEQQIQNDRLAQQSKAIVDESHQLALAAKELVTADAEARTELISAQEHLQSELNQQQVQVDRERSELDDERREIAGQRHRDPLIANSIQSLGLLIGCSLPLLICVYLLRRMPEDEPDAVALAECLILEFTSDEPRLLTGPSRGQQSKTSLSLDQEHHQRSMGFLNDTATDDPRADLEPELGLKDEFSDEDEDLLKPAPPF